VRISFAQDVASGIDVCQSTPIAAFVQGVPGVKYSSQPWILPMLNDEKLCTTLAAVRFFDASSTAMG
jgi:hypothetical protein